MVRGAWYGHRMKATYALVAALTLCCAPKDEDRSTAAKAFACLAPCVDRNDARCVFAELERGSRWSIQTIRKTLAEMRGLIERSYPMDKRTGTSAYGAWGKAVAAADDAETFAMYCSRQNCMEKIAAGFAAIVSEKSVDVASAELVTTRGGFFRMAVADGEWGLATYGADLAAEKIRLLDALAQVRLDARAYEEQRRAVGGSPPHGEEKKK
jgi:hypothetical protein